MMRVVFWRPRVRPGVSIGGAISVIPIWKAFLGEYLTAEGSAFEFMC